MSTRITVSHGRRGAYRSHYSMCCCVLCATMNRKPCHEPHPPAPAKLSRSDPDPDSWLVSAAVLCHATSELRRAVPLTRSAAAPRLSSQPNPTRSRCFAAYEVECFHERMKLRAKVARRQPPILQVVDVLRHVRLKAPCACMCAAARAAPLMCMRAHCCARARVRGW